MPVTFHVHFAILLIVLGCFCESALTPEIRDFYKSLISGNGLYGEEDRIVILNVTNFKSKVYKTNNAWLVEFYNSWCGHCHNFAPIWKSLAANVYGEWNECNED